MTPFDDRRDRLPVRFHQCAAVAYLAQDSTDRCLEQTRTTVDGVWLCAFHRLGDTLPPLASPDFGVRAQRLDGF